MSGGGHFSSYLKLNNQSYTFLPLLKRLGTNTIVPFLRRDTNYTSETSKDPLTVTRPVSEPVPGQPHETDRIIKLAVLSSGKGEKSFVDSSDSEEDLPSVPHSSSEFEIKSLAKPPKNIVTSGSSRDSEEPPRKKTKKQDFSGFSVVY